MAIRDEDLRLNIIVNGNESKKQLGDLTRAIKDTKLETEKLKREQAKLKEEGKENTTAYTALTKTIKDNQASIKENEAQVKNLIQTMKIEDLTEGELIKKLKVLKELRKDTEPNSAPWKQYNDEMQAVVAKLAELNPKAEQTGETVSDLGGDLENMAGGFVAGALSVTALVTGLMKINETYAEFTDRVADVQKTTGLANEEVLALNEEFKKMDTRTQQQDLLNLAAVAGKLGIEGSEDVLEFVKAADQIGVALSEDLGGNVEESINEIGKLVEIFNLKQEFGLGGAILKIGSAINELGANSSAKEAYLIEFAKRVAGVAPAAKISIQNILGLGATLDQLGQTAEVSGTAFNDIIPSMFKATGTYARIAGMEVGDFTKLLNSDTNAALIKVLEGVKGGNASFGEMVNRLDQLGIDGSKATTVLSALAEKVGLLKEQQGLSNVALLAGSSITAEYNIKNNTAAANLDRAKKAIYNMTVELGERLNPAMQVSTSLFVSFLQILSTLATFLFDHYRIIGTITAAYIGYNAVLLISNTLGKESVIVTKLMLLWTKAQEVAERSLQGSTILLAGAKALLTGNITRASAAMRMFNMVVGANPIAIFIAVLAAAASALYLYSGQLTDTQRAQEALINAEAEARKSIIAQRIEVERLISIAKDKTKSDEERIEALQLLNRLSPQYLGFLSLENINTEKATSATNNYIDSLLKVARVKAAASKLEEIESQRIDLELKGAESTFWQKVKSSFLGDYKTLQAEYKKANKEAALKSLNEETDALNAYINKNQPKKIAKSPDKTGSGDTGLDDDQVKAREKYAKEAKSQLEREKISHNERLKEVGLFGKERKDMTDADLQTLQDLEKIYSDNIATINTKANKQNLASLKKEEKQAALILQQQKDYRTEMINSQKSEIEQENIAHLERLKKAGIDENNIKKDQIDSYEAILKLHKAKLDKLDADAITKHIDGIEKQFAIDLRGLRIKNNEELASIKTVDEAKARLADSLSATELDKIKTLAQAKKALKEKYDQDEIKLTEGQMAELTDILKTAIEKGDFTNLKLSDHVFSEDELKVLADRIGIAKEKLSELLASEKDPGETGKVDKAYSFSTGKTDVLGMSIDDWTLFHTNLEKGKYGVGEMAMAVQALSSVWSTYSAFVSASENRQLKEFEKNTNEKKLKLDSQLKAGKISQQSYSDSVAKLDLELDEKKAEVELKQAKREKQVQIMSGIAGTASAIVGALGMKPFTPFNLIMAGIVGAMGAAQIATILAAPLPGKEDGGFLDVVRAQDKKRFKAKNSPDQRGYIPQPTVLVSENGEEFVATAAAVNNPTIRPILDIIDDAQRNGTISTVNLDKILSDNAITRSIPGRQNGGYVSEDSMLPGMNNISIADPVLVKILQETLEVNRLLVKKLSMPIEATVALTGKQGLNAKQAELDELIKNANL
jgi:TP901 family phage tail tape measure protein